MSRESLAAKKAAEDRAESLAELARSLDFRSGGSFSRTWTPEEVAAFQAWAFSALRLRDASRLRSTIEMFGGIPEGSPENKDLLFWAAKDPDAWGFADIYRHVVSVDPVLSAEARLGLGAFLRRGICLAEGGRASASGKDLAVSSLRLSHECFYPIGACLAADNPAALAWILGDGSRFNALAAAEPRGRFEGDKFMSSAERRSSNILREYQAQTWRIADEQDARLEKTILFQAVAGRAPRCAALLASIPEFSQSALDPERLRGGLNVNSSVFVSEVAWESGGGGAAREQVSLFEMAIANFKKDFQPYPPFTFSDFKEWEEVLARMIKASPAAAKEWRQQNGLGLPEIYFATDAELIRVGLDSGGGVRVSQNRERVLRIMMAFADCGFEVQWDLVASQCSKAPELAEWLRIQGAVFEARANIKIPLAERGPRRSL